jgi:hypothetical protein
MKPPAQGSITRSCSEGQLCAEGISGRAIATTASTAVERSLAGSRVNRSAVWRSPVKPKLDVHVSSELKPQSQRIGRRGARPNNDAQLRDPAFERLGTFNGITACCQSPRCGCSSEAAGTANSAVCPLESLHSTDMATFVAKPSYAGRRASQRPSKSALLSLCRICLNNVLTNFDVFLSQKLFSYPQKLSSFTLTLESPLCCNV